MDLKRFEKVSVEQYYKEDWQFSEEEEQLATDLDSMAHYNRHLNGASHWNLWACYFRDRFLEDAEVNPKILFGTGKQRKNSALDEHAELTLDFKDGLRRQAGNYIADEVNLSDFILPFRIVFSGIHFAANFISSRAKFLDALEVVGSSFKKDFHLSNCEVIGNTTFEGTKFHQRSYFSQSVFESDALFINTRFLLDACFDAIKFNGDSDFKNSQFEAKSNFTKATFTESSTFVHSIFLDDAKFLGSKFNNIAEFTNCEFRSECLFRNSKFNNKLDFSDTEFQGDTFFNHAYFHETTLFKSANFSGYADFAGCQFYSSITFSGSEFISAANFNNSIFWKKSYFSFCSIAGAYFEYSYFLDDANFRLAEFTDLCHIENCIFFGDFTFNDTRTRKAFLFGDTCFLATSDFDGSSFDASTIFRNLYFGKIIHNPQNVPLPDELAEKISNHTVDTDADTIPNFVTTNFAIAPDLQNLSFTSIKEPKSMAVAVLCT